MVTLALGNNSNGYSINEQTCSESDYPVNRLHNVNEVKLPVNGAHMDPAACNGQAPLQNAAIARKNWEELSHLLSKVSCLKSPWHRWYGKHACQQISGGVGVMTHITHDSDF